MVCALKYLLTDNFVSIWIMGFRLVYVSGFNLGLLMRQLTGVGTPRSLQGRAVAVLAALTAALRHLWALVAPSWALDAQGRPDWSSIDAGTWCHEHLPLDSRIGAFATGC